MTRRGPPLLLTLASLSLAAAAPRAAPAAEPSTISLFLSGDDLGELEPCG